MVSDRFMTGGAAAFVHRVNIMDIRRAALCLAVAVYGLAGSPTPDHIGWAEYAAGALLILAAGLRPAHVFLSTGPAPLWETAGRILLFYGLSLAVLSGFVHGYDPAMILRDVVALLFLLLPLFTVDLFERNPAFFKVFLAVLIALAMCFAVRGLIENTAPASAIAPHAGQTEPHYFANSPVILFAAIYLCAQGITQLIRRPGAADRLMALLLIALGILLLPPLVITMQRASLGYFSLAMAVMVLAGIVRAPLRMLPLLVIAGVLAVFFWDMLMLVFDRLYLKTLTVGLNSRAEELHAVWAALSSSVYPLIAGLGWGAGFASPAVGDVYVNFTHSLWSAMLLKTGMAGLLITMLYIGGFLKILSRMAAAGPPLALALAGPLLIPVLLYASYKSLDFGLILLVLAGWAVHSSKVASEQTL